MKDFSRRQFLKQLGAAAGLFLASRSVLSLPKFVFSNESETFEMLVVGDSHISGQGLQQKNKFFISSKNGFKTKFLAKTARSI